MGGIRKVASWAYPVDHGTGSRSQTWDRRDVDGALVHELALVIAGRNGAEPLQPGETALDGLRFCSVRCRRPAGGRPRCRGRGGVSSGLPSPG